MTDLPAGCSKTVQVSFIEDVALRPQEDFQWLVHAVDKTRGTMVTCRKTQQEAYAEGTKFLGLG